MQCEFSIAMLVLMNTRLLKTHVLVVGYWVTLLLVIGLLVNSLKVS